MPHCRTSVWTIPGLIEVSHVIHNSMHFMFTQCCTCSINKEITVMDIKVFCSREKKKDVHLGNWACLEYAI